MINAALASTVANKVVSMLIGRRVPGGQQGQEHVRFCRLQGELSMKTISTPLVSRTKNNS